MFLSPTTLKNTVRSQSPSRVQNYQSPNLPKTARKVLNEPNQISASTEFKNASMPNSSVTKLDVTCINCQNLIPLDKIENHSKVCTNIQADIQRLEQGSYLNEVLFKLTKLQACLNDQSQYNLGASDKNYLKILTRFCETCKFGTFLTIESTLQSLFELLSNFKGTLPIRIYAERLQILLVELRTLLEQTEIENKKQELQKIKNEVEKYKNRTEIIQQTLMKTVSADKLRIIREKIFEISAENISDETSEASRNMEEEKTEDSEYKTLQKHFFSLCLSIKMKLPKNLRTKNFSIQELFVKAKKMKISPDNWAEFISQELKKDGKTRHRRVNKSIGAFNFEVIIEEQC